MILVKWLCFGVMETKLSDLKHDIDLMIAFSFNFVNINTWETVRPVVSTSSYDFFL